MILDDYIKEPNIERTQISIARDSSKILRLHTFGETGYSVGLHTANMMHILMALWPSKDVPAILVRAIMSHDVAEMITGDIPGPAKYEYPVINRACIEAEIEIELNIYPDAERPTVNHFRWLKSIDLLELYLWGLEKRASGDRSVGIQLLVKRVSEYIESKKGVIPPEVLKFYNDIRWHHGWAGLSSDDIGELHC